MNDAMPNILVYRTDNAETYAEYLRQHGCSAAVSASTPDEARRLLPGTEVLFCWKFPAALLSLPEAASLRWIQSMGAGVDDLLQSGAIPPGVVFTRVVDQFGGPIAEYVFGYMLLIEKELERFREAQTKRLWSPSLTGFLSGKTIGVAGLGSIGREIVRKARAFDLNVYGLSLSGKMAHIVDRHFGAQEWPAFVAELDYLVVTLPLTEETRCRINREVLLAMKPEAVLINVGRGQLLVQDELIDLVKAGRLKAAVLDVFETEPLPPESELWSLPNVYVTPHISGPSMAESVCRLFLKNLQSYRRGTAMQGVVDRQRGY